VLVLIDVAIDEVAIFELCLFRDFAVPLGTPFSYLSSSSDKICSLILLFCLVYPAVDELLWTPIEDLWRLEACLLSVVVDEAC
jgi:hypothetical protein